MDQETLSVKSGVGLLQTFGACKVTTLCLRPSPMTTLCGLTAESPARKGGTQEEAIL